MDHVQSFCSCFQLTDHPRDSRAGSQGDEPADEPVDEPEITRTTPRVLIFVARNLMEIAPSFNLSFANGAHELRIQERDTTMPPFPSVSFVPLPYLSLCPSFVKAARARAEKIIGEGVIKKFFVGTHFSRSRRLPGKTRRDPQPPPAERSGGFPDRSRNQNQNRETKTRHGAEQLHKSAKNSRNTARPHLAP